MRFCTDPLPLDENFMSLGEFMRGAVRIPKSMNFTDAEREDLLQNQKVNQQRRNETWGLLAHQVVGAEMP